SSGWRCVASDGCGIRWRMLAVQIVSVSWTKASRGNPGAAQRNRIPRAFPLLGKMDGSDFIERHQFREAASGVFQEAPCSHEVLPLLSVQMDGLLLELTGGKLRVGFKWTEHLHGMPPLPREVYSRAVKGQAFVLSAGDSLQLRINGRHGGKGT